MRKFRSGLVVPRLVARDRIAPPPTQRTGLDGWVSWALIDRSGRAVNGGEQHNLMLDTMLDAFATRPMISSLSSAMSYFAVGDGSATPDVTDVALENEVGERTNTLISSSFDRLTEGVYESTVEREFDFAQGNGNLTEFGFAPGSSGPLYVRELFRDAAGNPITLTKTNEFKLRIKYTVTTTLAPTFTTPTPHSFPIEGIGLIDGHYFFQGGPASGTPSALDVAATEFVARGATGAGAENVIGRPCMLAPNELPSAYTDSPRSTTDAVASGVSWSDYLPGSFQRSVSGVFGTAVGNQTPAALCVASGRSAGRPIAGFLFVVDENDRFVKDSFHQLTVNDLLTVSWSRA